MPGLLSHHLRDADALHFCPIQFPLPSRIPSTRSTDFRRMPLHHLTTVRYDVNETTLDLPEEPRINQHNNHLLINHNDQVHNKDNYRFASEFPSNLHGSAESENDLAAMVHDFMENGSYGSDFPESSDGENGITNGPKLFETLQVLSLFLHAEKTKKKCSVSSGMLHRIGNFVFIKEDLFVFFV